MKKIIALVLAMAMIMSFAACAKKTTEEPAQQEDEEVVITMASVNAWSSCDPLAVNNGGQTMFNQFIWDTLVSLNADGSVDPRLAESYEVADDYSSITFHINQKATFSDGEPVTADDVVFSANLYVNKDVTNLRRGGFSYFAGTDKSGVEESSGSLGVEKIDDYTVRFTFKTPMNELACLADWNPRFYILPKHIWENKTIEQINDANVWAENMIGSGPCTLVAQELGVEAEFAAREDYYLGAPQFDTLIFSVVDSSTVLAGLTSGDIDITTQTLSVADFQDAKKIDGMICDSTPSNSYWIAMFNNEKIPLEVRSAFEMAINKQVIVDNLYQGEGEVLTSVYPSTHAYYEECSSRGYDPEAAKKQLEDYGFDFSQEYSYSISSGTGNVAQIATLIQQDLAAIGVKLRIDTMEMATLQANMAEGNFDIASWASTGTAEPSSFFILVNPLKARNFCRIDNTIGEMVLAATSITDIAQQKSAYHEIAQYVVDQVPAIYLCATNGLTVHSDKISNVDYGQFGLSEYNCWEWQISK